MRRLLTAAVAALTMTAGVAAAGSAAAHPNRDRDRDHGAAIVAGVAGLAIGAALASGSRGDRYGYYDRGYYDRGYYDRRHYDRRSYGHYPPPGYYRPPRYGYAPPYGYAYGYRHHRPQRCRTVSRWDPYYRTYVRRTVCR